MKISILGAGNVGGTLGTRLGAQGSRCLLWRSPCRRCRDAGTSANHRAGTVAEAAAASDMIVLATPWPATRDAIQAAGNLAGKVVVDCTNPLKEDFSGLALGYTTSGAEQVAEWAKGAKVFKAFNQTGFNIMGNPAFDGQRAVIFVCGDDDARKPTVLQLATDIGFEAIDAGNLVIARLLEPYGMLWIHLAYARGMGRDFAFVLHRREKEAA